MTLVKQQISEKQAIWAHAPDECLGPFCAIHNPSDHPMRDFPLYWRDDRGLMERICPHGVGHPDPDDLSFKKSHMPDYDRYAFGVHACDGCCTRSTNAVS